MASDLVTKAKEAFIDDHFELAVDLYSQAIDINPNNAELFADRAQANIKLNNLTEAVADANRAIELDASTTRAYLRKGIACLKLEEYETAKAALETGASLAPGDSRFISLIKECNELIAEETSHLSKQTPEVPTNTASLPDPQPVSDLSSQASVVPPAKPKYRHEFYQKPDVVVVSIFAKGIPPSCVSVDYGEQILSVNINVPGQEEYHFQPRLFGKIVPANCKFDVLSTKIEIRLAKAEPIQWTSLEYSKEPVALQRAIVTSGSLNSVYDEQMAKITSDTGDVTFYPSSKPGTGSHRPTYPSSKPKGINWDKLEAEVKKEEKEEKLDGDAALNKFFKEIYHDADEDTRRAMSKSFVESNGTVLSTNWKEVGSKKVEGSPPDGMEMKKWEY